MQDLSINSRVHKKVGLSIGGGWVYLAQAIPSPKNSQPSKLPRHQNPPLFLFSPSRKQHPPPNCCSQQPPPPPKPQTTLDPKTLKPKNSRTPKPLNPKAPTKPLTPRPLNPQGPLTPSQTPKDIVDIPSSNATLAAMGYVSPRMRS